MSQDSTSISNIQKIFDSMDYGPISESKSLAEAWLKENSENLGCFIDGKLFQAQEPQKVETISTGVNFCISHCTQEHLNAAVLSSSSAFPKWAEVTCHARSSIIYSIARQIQKHSSLLCEIEACSKYVQVGNVREVDVPALVRTFYYYAGWAQLLETHLSEWRPTGPALGVTSSDAPLSSLAMFIAPALAAGNTIILIPDVSNCLSAIVLAQLCTAAGVPPGVINVVPQNHSLLEGHLVMDDKGFKIVSVIGSPSLGRSISRSSCNPRQNPIMLLNGCVPMVVMDCADLDGAVDCAVDAICLNQGQDPWALRLVVVQESVYSSFKLKLMARVASLKTGSTFEKLSDVSDALIDKSIAARLQEIMISDPSSEVLQPVGSSSEKWSPTFIFSAAPPSEPVLHCSKTCPVVHIVGARSAKEAINIANHCGGGVAASVWTESSAVAWESSLQLKTSTVWINGFGILDASIPISGRNSTGSGCFLGKEGLLEHLQPAHVPAVLSSYVHPNNTTSLLPLAPEGHCIDQTYKLFYGGGHKRPSSYRTVLDGNGKTIAVVPDANRKDVRNAVEAAVKAQPGWWKRGSFNRAQIIFNLAEKLQARRDHFSSCLKALYHSLDQSKCLQEVDECVKLLFHFAALCDKAILSSNQSVGDMTVVVQREPLGVIALVSGPWAGSALAGLVAQIGAAVAYGNTCVLISDLEWALPALELALLLEAAEVPAGVVNILSGITSALLPSVSGHMDINAVWCAGDKQNSFAGLPEESSKSNLKKIWVVEKVSDPCAVPEIYEMKASQSKAVWWSGRFSFGG